MVALHAALRLLARGGAIVALLVLVVVACSAPDRSASRRTPIPTPSPARAPSLQLSPTVTPAARATATASAVAATATPLPPAPLAGRVTALGQPVLLRPTIEVQVGTTGSTIILEGVERDSRCPADVACIQAGSVTATFNVWDGKQAYRESLTLRDGTTARVVLGTLEITLLAIEPAPLAGHEVRPFDYRAMVVVDRPAARGPTGIDGLVTLGPMCPVVRADQPCPDRPYEATLVVRSATGTVVARVESGTNGRFALDLPPGRYTVDPQLPGPGRMPYASAVEVTVPIGARAAVTVAYDTGIR